MRWALVLPLLLSGCLFEPGLGSSPTQCPDSTPVADGFRVSLDAPGPFVGYCMEMSLDGVEEAQVLRRVPADGVVHLPVAEAGRYYLHISVEDPDDKYCAAHYGDFIQHPGTGLVEVAGETGMVCA